MPSILPAELTPQLIAVAALSALVGALLILLLSLVRLRVVKRQLCMERDRLEDERGELKESEGQNSREIALLIQEREHYRINADEQSARLHSAEAERESWRRRTSELDNRNATIDAERAAAVHREQSLQRELSALRERLDEAHQSLASARIAIREQEVTLEEERRATSEKLTLLERNRDALKQEFENLANRIFDQKSERFTQQNRQSLDTLLTPFRDQLQDFRKRVDDVYTQETRDRQALRSEIDALQKLNRQITEEASNLTRALKGDRKIQGNWGELILERVLERSGLRKGVEYDTQGSYRDGGGQLLRPDVVVHLPDNRNLIIDSKVSLSAYQQWAAEEDEAVRMEALKRHVEAVREHIKSLSEKDYSQLHGLHSPDFVFLFMPIEPAFIAAFQQDENLFGEAFESKIIVVTPTTLLATLRTIENIWRYERQSENARRIADRAGAVYDKLRVFAEAMERLEGQLLTTQNTFDSAMNTLTRGKGNLISQADRFVKLGVRVRKELPKTTLTRAEIDDPDDDEDELVPDELDDKNIAREHSDPDSD